MSLVIPSARAANEPATHVFIVGVDDYPWIERALPGYQSLSACCNSAQAFFKWITTSFQNRAAPLGSVRILLSPPADGEIVIEPRPAPATRQTFYHDALAWAQDLSTHRDNVGIFYFSGHGFGLGFDRRALALMDVGQSDFAPFQDCVSFDNLYAGLAPNQRIPQMARQQYFFIDSAADRLAIPDYLERNASHIFAVQTSSLPDDRVAPIFAAAAPGSNAYARKDGLTIFAQALLNTLDGAGAEPANRQPGYDSAAWVITARSLAGGLAAESQRLQSKQDLVQQFSSSGLMGNSVLHELKTRPLVLIGFDASDRPEPDFVVKLKELPAGDELKLHFDANNRRREIALPAGVYQAATATVDGVPFGPLTLVMAHPPFAEVRL